MKDTIKLIEERESTHGDFESKAVFIQLFKAEVRLAPSRLTPTQHEALDNIIQKIGRIVYGDPNCQDHWDDIAGYAKLSSRSNK